MAKCFSSKQEIFHTFLIYVFFTNPFMLPHFQVDKGAIKFVLNGSHIMCPGLTSPGGRLTDVPANTVVAIMAEGKEHALAIGVTVMSSQDILKINKDIGVNLIHYLNDGLWRTDKLALGRTKDSAENL
ncbi:Malignant T-cell-amplified sequence 1-A [Cichlidogyrus casuarinus]|uniref:Malignant T-cell-amplified sequence 1-A n=1 Tax=Cichlidogyrus casuarinus TaxID=1844966 RepID=A0ABD2QHW9_9PLAT